MPPSTSTSAPGRRRNSGATARKPSQRFARARERLERQAGRHRHQHAVGERALGSLSGVAAKRYAAQVRAGENPWNTIDRTAVDATTIERTPAPPHLTESIRKAPVVLVVCVDLKVVASTDQELPRVGIISGASIYPFAWNILLGARQEGFAGTITTLAVAQEPKIQELLGIPGHVAVCAVMPLGRPVKRITKLERKAVSEFATRERWGGEPFTSGGRA